MQHVNDDTGANNPTILFEDDHLVALNKPAGLVVHSDGRTTESTLVDWIHARYPGIKDIGGLHTLDSERYVPRFGVVHRLDRETSGVILVAKDDETFFFLQQQFISRTNTKTYLAFVLGVPEHKEGVIDLPIGRGRVDFRQWATGVNARGTLRKAITHYKVIAHNKNVSLLELTPKTGRTHQLRVHLKSIGYPILCDKRYESPTDLGFKRLALHAKSISFEYPKGSTMTTEAPLPDDFKQAMSQLS